MKAWKLSSRELSFQKPLIMGILNVTPDSFSDGGQFFNADAAAAHAEKMIQDGADILDLGAESTRPGAKPVSSSEQLKRLLPVLEKTKTLNAVVSVDTTRVEVAEACLAAGAEIINDVSGLRDSDGKLAGVVARYRAGLILMHRRGNSETMQKLTDYDDVTGEVIAELGQSAAQAEGYGVAKESIILDPGLGFSKTAEQSLFLLKEIHKFNQLGFPVLVGASRKSFIGKIIGREALERDWGTAGCTAYAYAQGIRFFRVHDVKGTRDVLNMLEAIQIAELKPNMKTSCL